MKKSFMDIFVHPDNKYFIFLFFVAMNAMTFSTGNHHAAFASTSIICIILIYFERKTQTLLNQSFENNRVLLNDLKKVDMVVRKLPEKERANFEKVYKNL